MSIEDTYLQFLELLLKGYFQEAGQFLAPGFRATIKSGPEDLTFAELSREVDRQRVVFPDLGQRILVRDVVRLHGRLVVTYLLTTKFAGTLDDTVLPTNETYEILAQDLVDFDDGGRITNLETVTDMRHTMALLFPPQ